MDLNADRSYKRGPQNLKKYIPSLININEKNQDYGINHIEISDEISKFKQNILNDLFQAPF